jgi:hypothetical protein
MEATAAFYRWVYLDARACRECNAGRATFVETSNRRGDVGSKSARLQPSVPIGTGASLGRGC